MIMMRGRGDALSPDLPSSSSSSLIPLSPTLPDRSFYLLLLFSRGRFLLLPLLLLCAITSYFLRDGKRKGKGGHHHSIRPSTLLHTVWKRVGFENEVGRRRRGGKIASLRLLLLFAAAPPLFCSFSPAMTLQKGHTSTKRRMGRARAALGGRRDFSTLS